MAKESKETYSGKLKDQTFEVFDEKVLTWCRKQFGDYYAKGLWRNELTVLDYLNLDDDEDLFTFEMHCSRVYEVLAIKSPKEADHTCSKATASGPRSGKWSSGRDAVKESSATWRKSAVEKQQGN